jgi:hypothetical protein
MRTSGRALLVAVSAIVVAGPVRSAPSSGRGADGRTTDALIQALLRQGVSRDQILGVDPRGIPIVSETAAGHAASSKRRAAPATLPAGTRGWETIPGVIRDDGVDTFRVEVDAGGPVAHVTMTGVSGQLVPPAAPPFTLRDDGRDGDRVAGDFVFTSGPFTYNVAQPMFPFYRLDPDSPAGLEVLDAGDVTIEELDGSTTQFLLKPSVGVLRSDVPATSRTAVAPDIVVSPHLVNIRSSARATQQFLRGRPVALSDLTRPILAVLPDAFDFFFFFSADKIENLPYLSVPNFHAGVHALVQVDYTGTGLAPFDGSAAYGSRGRLLGVNVMDAYERGILSNNATHELVHQWASYTDPALGLSDGTAHYGSRTSVGSLVGGFLWIDNHDGTFTRDCTEGRGGGAHHAPPLDKYMMGLIDGAAVPPLHVDLGSDPICIGPPNVIDAYATTTIDDIQRVHGVRAPGPATAQRDFAIAFVVESHDRLLDATEMTFYDLLAAHYTKPVPADRPDPYLGFNWVPIERFFGEGTTWRSDIPLPDTIEVQIDVERDALPKSGKSRMPIAVAILSTDGFDATTVDPTTVTFGPGGATDMHRRGRVQDVDGDGDLDLVLHFRADETDIPCGVTSASLTGRTYGGLAIAGSDTVRRGRCK